MGALIDNDSVTVFAVPTTRSLLQRIEGGRRTLLTEATTWYVDGTSGSDSNDGLSSGAGAFATIQHAVDVVSGLYDFGPYQATISVADDTYTDPTVLGNYVGQLPPLIQGNTTTPANCVINCTDEVPFNSSAHWRIAGFKILGGLASYGLINAVANSLVEVSNIEFGAAATNVIHMAATDGGVIRVQTNYAISGGAYAHVQAANNAFIFAGFRTVTITNTPGFTNAFARSLISGTVYLRSNTYSGSATGVRYLADRLGLIHVNGAGATYLPGDSAGSVTNSGVYA
jgi:hypothetical protein